MPGKIEQGFGKEPGPEPDPDTEPFANIATVHIITDSFEAEVLSVAELPGFDVLDMLAAEGNEQLMKVASLFHLAVQDPNKADQVRGLPFHELRSAVAQWVAGSNTGSGDGVGV